MYNINQNIKNTKIKTPVKILFSPVNLLNRGAKTSIKIKSFFKKANYIRPAYRKFNVYFKKLFGCKFLYLLLQIGYRLNKKYNSLKSTLKPGFFIFNYILMFGEFYIEI